MKNPQQPSSPCKIKFYDQEGFPHEKEMLGLTKREMFAMSAMNGVLSGNSISDLVTLAQENELTDVTPLIIDMSLNAADELLKELAK